MKKPLNCWNKLLGKLGYRVDWNASKNRRKNQKRQSSSEMTFERLQPREMLADMDPGVVPPNAPFVQFNSTNSGLAQVEGSTVNLDFYLNQTLAHDVIVKFKLVDGSATWIAGGIGEGDYAFTDDYYQDTLEVRFHPGDALQKRITVDLLTDDRIEGDETYQVIIDEVIGAEKGENDTFDGVIQDETGGGGEASGITVRFVDDSGWQYEGQELQALLRVDINDELETGPESIFATVDLVSNVGSATPGDDFIFDPITVFFDSDGFATVSIDHLDDDVFDEGVEYYELEITAAGGAEFVDIVPYEIFRGFIIDVDLSNTDIEIDLDIDTDNDGSPGEASEDPNEADTSLTGKLIPVNDSDADQDNIVDWYDSQIPGDVTQFTPLLVTLDDNNALELDSASFQFEYVDDGAIFDPNSSGSLVNVPPWTFGNIRIWKQEFGGGDWRNPDNLIRPGSSYTAEDLGFTFENKQITLYVEGVHDSLFLAEELIKVTVTGHSIYGDAISRNDEVRATVIQADLDIDSDNDNQLGFPTRSSREDHIENWIPNSDNQNANPPGKLIAANNGDVDQDGIPDLLDPLIKSDGSPRSRDFRFTPVVISLPNHVNLDDGELRLDYGPEVRVWTSTAANFDVERQFDVFPAGDWVNSGTIYTPIELDHQNGTIVLYVEGRTPGALGQYQMGLTYFVKDDADTVLTDVVRFEILETDVDVDSDNLNGYVPPAKDDPEDQIEFDPDLPGKIIVATDGDGDNDGVIDYADWEIPGRSFAPVVLHLSDVLSEISEKGYGDVSLSIQYLDSDPNQASNGGTPFGGNIRLWTKNADQLRNPNAVNDPQTPGDYVAQGVYSLDELGFVQADGSLADSVTLFVEGVSVSDVHVVNGNVQSVQEVISVDGYLNGVRIGQLIDDVQVTVTSLDADVDSDNNNGKNLPDRSFFEDTLEDDDEEPGKIISANRGNLDGDGIDDYLDGFNLDGIVPSDDDTSLGVTFTPLIVEVPAVIGNPSNARLQFVYDQYDASQPATTPPEDLGRIRIWKVDAQGRTDVSDIVTSGGIYTLADLGYNAANQDGIVVVYVEGILTSHVPGDVQVEVNLIGSYETALPNETDPYNPTGTAAISEDLVRLTVRGATHIEVSAPDRFAREVGEEDISQDDFAFFTFSRGEAASNERVDIRYRLVGSAVNANEPTYREIQLEPGVSRKSVQLVPTGMATTGTQIELEALDADGLVEWDQHLGVEVISVATFDAGGHPTQTVFSYSNSNFVRILDSDGVESINSRNVDYSSTELVRSSTNVGAVNVDQQDGTVSLALATGHGLYYNGDNSLQPIIDIVAEVPNTAPITSLTADLTFGFAQGIQRTFQLVNSVAGETVHLVVMASEEVARLYSTGHYSYDVVLRAATGSGNFTRTYVGGTEYVNTTINRRGDEFGKGWRHSELDRLYFDDGLTGRFTRAGLEARTGVAHIRGDNTSAYYEATITDPASITPLPATPNDVAQWHTSSDGYLYADESSFDSPFTESPTATWDFTVRSREAFQVFVEWTPDFDRASSVTYRVNGAQRLKQGGANAVEVRVDQRFTPGDFELGGKRWRSLGWFITEDGVESVEQKPITLEVIAENQQEITVAGDAFVAQDFSYSDAEGSPGSHLAYKHSGRQSVEFDGVDSRVLVPSAGTISATDDYEYSFRIHSKAGTNLRGGLVIHSWNYGYGVLLSQDHGRILVYGRGTSPLMHYDPPGGIIDVTMDIRVTSESGITRLYLNGEEVKSTDRVATANPTNADVYLGSSRTQYYHNGSISNAKLSVNGTTIFDLTLNDGEGTEATDVSGNGNDGMLQGGAAWSGAQDVEFDGVDSRVLVPGAGTISATDDYEYSFRVHSEAGTNLRGGLVIHSWNYGYGVLLSQDNGRILVYGRGSSPLMHYDPPGGIIDVTMDIRVTSESGITRLYLNGEEVKSTTRVATANPTNADVYLGSSRTQYYHNGSISNAKLIVNGTTIFDLGLNDGTGTQATDSSGNGHHGVLEGGAAWSEAQPQTFRPHGIEGIPRKWLTLENRHGDSMLFSGDGLLLSRFDRHGNQSRYEYANRDGDAWQDELVKITRQGNRSVEYNYTNNYLASVSDFRLKEGPSDTLIRLETSYQVVDGLLKQITLPDTGYVESETPVFSFDYDDDLALTNVRQKQSEQHDLVTKIDYDPSTQRVNSVTLVSAEYDASRIWKFESQFEDALAHTRKAGFGDLSDTSGVLKQPRSTVIDPANNTWVYQTDRYGLVRAVQKPLLVGGSGQHTWLTERDNQGRVVRFLEPSVVTTEDDYGLPKREAAVTRETFYEYDANGNLERITYAKGSGVELVESWQWAEEVGLGVSFWAVHVHTATNGVRTRYNYDKTTSPFQIIENEGGSGVTRTTTQSFTDAPTNIESTPGGLLSTSTVGGQTMSYSYYAAADLPSNQQELPWIGLLKSETVSGGTLSLTTSYEYDKAGFLKKVTTPGDVVTEYEHDNLGQLIATKYPKQSFVGVGLNNDVEFDSNGLPIATERTIQKRDVNHYDAAGNLIRFVEHRDNPAAVGYDIFGFDTSFGAVTDYVFNEFGELEREVLPLPQSVSTTIRTETEYQYDKRGNVSKEILHYDGKQRATEYQYDEWNQMVLSKLDAPIFDTELDANLIPEEAKKQSIITYRYDVTGNLIFQSDPREKYNSISGTADPQFLVGNLTYFDIFDRVVAEAVGSKAGNFSSDSPITKFDYDNAGRLTAVYERTGRKPDGEVGIVAEQYAQTNYEYDNLNRRTLVLGPLDEHSQRLQTKFVYDELDNIEEEQRTAKIYTGDTRPDGAPTFSATTTTVYTYDSLGRLAGSISPSFNGDEFFGKQAATLYAYNEYGFVSAELVYEITSPVNLEPKDLSTLINDARNLTAAGKTAQLTRYRYNPLGQVIAEVSPDMGGESASSENLSDNDGSVVKLLRYDLSGNNVLQISLFKEIRGNLDPSPSPVRVTSSYTAGTRFDNLNRIWSQLGEEDSLGNQIEFSTMYNGDGTINYTTGSNQERLSEFSYDNLGRRYRSVNFSDQEAEPVTETWFTDTNGNVLRSFDSFDWYTDYTYDNFNRQKTETNYVAQEAIANGHAPEEMSHGDRNAITTTRTFFADGLLKQETQFNSDYSLQRYDHVGNYLGKSLHRLVRVGETISQEITNTQLHYDGFGNHVHTITDTGAETWSVFDRRGNKTSQWMKINPTTSQSGWRYEYDFLDRLVSRSSGDESTNLEYNDRNWVVSETLEEGLSYDQNRFSYTPFGELVSAAAYINGTKSYEGQITSEGQMTSKYSYQYNSAREIELFVQEYSFLNHDVRTSFTHDGVGLERTEAISYSDQNIVTRGFGFDQLGRVRKISQSGSAVDSLEAKFEFERSRLKKSTYSPTSMSSSNFISYRYFPDGRAKIIDFFGEGTNLPRSSYVFEYERMGRLVEQTIEVGTDSESIVWTEEDFFRPTSAVVTDYGQGYTENPGWDFGDSYDGSGNVKFFKSDIDDYDQLRKEVRVEYNTKQQVKSVEIRSQPPAGTWTTDTISYDYDALGNMVRTVSVEGDTTVERIYVPDFNGTRTLTFETSNVNDPQTNPGPAQLVGVSTNRLDGKTVFAQHVEGTDHSSSPYVGKDYAIAYYDHRGTWRYSMVHAAGNPVDSFSFSKHVFDADGRLKGSQTEFDGLIQQFSGYDYDIESSFYFNGDRAFFAGLGSYLTPDRSALASGATNLYQRTSMSPNGMLPPSAFGIDHFADSPSVWSQPEVIGAFEIVGGLLEIGGGVFSTIATGGIAGLLGGATAIVHGIDTTVAGVRNVFYSNGSSIARSVTFNLVASASGSDLAGNIADIGLGFVGPGAFAKAGSLGKAAANSTKAGRYALKGAANLSRRTFSATSNFAAKYAPKIEFAVPEPGFYAGMLHPFSGSKANRFRVAKAISEADTVPNRPITVDPRTARPQADSVYELNGYRFETNRSGNITRASGRAQLKTAGRNTNLQTNIGNEGVASDVGFHLIADIFNGPSNRLNIVPFNGKPINGLKNINGSAYKTAFEHPVKNSLRAGHDVELDIVVRWGANGRPQAITARYQINGGDWHGQTFRNIP